MTFTQNFKVFFKIFIFSALLLGSGFNAYAAKKPNVPKFWFKLLRYEKNSFGYKSQVINKKFFVSKNGRKSPSREWARTVSLLKNKNPKKRQAFACRFPARAYLASKYLKLRVPSFRSCQNFQKFLTKINLHKVSVVFSSYYLGSAASAFGHTFLRLHNKRARNSENELLDYGVNFSAQVTTSNPISYTIKGLFGGFRGTFGLMPFFLKKLEYNDFESRDLWSYELNLSPTELKLFSYHLWEMDQAKFDYSYFKENCSYHILAMLDSVTFKTDLLSELSPFIIPIETVFIILNQKNLVKKIQHRPSLTKLFQHKVGQLLSEEKDVLDQLIDDDNKYNLDFLSKSSQARVLDTAVAYGDMENRQTMHLAGKKKTSWIKKRNKLLSKRAKLRITKDVFYSYPANEAGPHLSHSPRKLLTGIQNFHKGKLRGIMGYRFSLHEILDPPKGYAPFSQMVMGDFRFHYNEGDARPKFNRFHMVSVDHRPKWQAYQKPMSWKIRFGAEEAQEIKGEGTTGFIDLSPGFSFGYDRMMLFTFRLSTQYRYFLTQGQDPDWSKSQLFAGAEAEFVLNVRNDLRIGFSYLKNFGIGADKWNEFLETKVRWDMSKKIGLELFTRGGTVAASSGANFHFFL